MEVIIILFLIACVVWIIWTVQARIRASRKAALDEAWRVVLSESRCACRNGNPKSQTWPSFDGVLGGFKFCRSAQAGTDFVTPIKVAR